MWDNFFQFLMGLIIGIFILTAITEGGEPPCTAYQAIDGKPVCIEYQLNK